MTTLPTEEELMALVDGELAPEAATRLQKAIDAAPELQHRVAVYTATRELLQKQYASRPYEPVPERLLNVITNSKQPTQNSWIAGLWQNVSASAMQVFSAQGTPAPMAITAGAAILFVTGILVGQTSTFIPSKGDLARYQSHIVSIGGVQEQSRINDALEKIPSGGKLELSEDKGQQHGQLKLVLTFKKGSGVSNVSAPGAF